MKRASKIRSTIPIVLLFAAITVAAQISREAKAPATAHLPAPLRVFPTPTNLKVLPKSLTGQQVRDLMKQWSAGLGVRCEACHLRDTESTGNDGKPHLSFADDAKPMKAVARIMYTMTESINSDYIATLNGSGMPVTCGTCHRGVISPAPFAPPAERPGTAQPAPTANQGLRAK